MLPHTSRLLALSFLAIAAHVLVTAAHAHDVITTQLTYSKEIVRIFHKHCASCHRDGADGPFSVMTYAAARPWATAIKEEVLARRMPPWGAVKGFGEFEDDRSLTQEEIHLIADWVEGGAPEGDPVLLPARPNLVALDPEPIPRGLTIGGTTTLKRPLVLHGLFSESAPPDNTKLTARLPTGEVLPLIWFYGMRPKFLHPFWLSTPLKLPAGTELRINSDAAIRLITKPRE
ncbi:MAG: cytochrome c [Acidobacteriota bacterium]